ncbi:MAG: hypothetical protein QOH15_2663 [Gaiellales bacterium]|nr:hypothetical protein [Gaiellales bacterium]
MFPYEPRARIPEGGPGLRDDGLVLLGGAAGIDDPQFAACVTSQSV